MIHLTGDTPTQCTTPSTELISDLPMAQIEGQKEPSVPGEKAVKTTALDKPEEPAFDMHDEIPIDCPEETEVEKREDIDVNVPGGTTFDADKETPAPPKSGMCCRIGCLVMIVLLILLIALLVIFYFK